MQFVCGSYTVRTKPLEGQAVGSAWCGSSSVHASPHQQVECEFRHWREARGKLSHVSNIVSP